MTASDDSDMIVLDQVQTLTELLDQRASQHPNRVALRFLEKGELDGGALTYAELVTKARRVAAGIQSRFPRGARGLIMCPPGLNYVVAFFGCLYAGAVAVPIYPPTPMVAGRAMGRLQAVAADVGASFAITVRSLARVTQSMTVADETYWLYVDDPDIGDEQAWEDPATESADLAFLQYTSGSTADPKGVMLTHGNVVANLRMIAQTYQLDAASSTVSWLPPYHDMGLVGGIITPLANGASTVLMSPDAFLRNPVRWLAAISKHRAVMSPAPNFAYELCVRRAAGADLGGLDLSTWRVAVNGAEPVRESTLRRFAETFAVCGLHPEFLWPSYGMAETTVLVSAGRFGADTFVVDADRVALAAGRLAAAEDGAESVSQVSCGRPTSGSQVVVVDPETGRPLPPNQIGEIWVAGPHVAVGYWGRPDETERTFQATTVGGPTGHFLRTGDLGCLANGQLIVAGRAKDVVIVRGINYHPQEFEQVMEAVHPALRPDCGVAFSLDEAGTEQLVLVQGVNLRATDGDDLADAADRIVRAVTASHRIRPDRVVLVAPKHVARTSSGKVRRSAMRAALVEDRLPWLYEWRSGSFGSSEAVSSSVGAAGAAG